MISEKTRRLLEKKRSSLTKSINLESSTLLAHLVSDDVITSEEKDFIETQGPAFKQVDALVKILLTKTDGHVERFIECLEDSGHGHVASDLREEQALYRGPTTRRTTGDREEKTVSVKAEISVKSNPSAELEETTEAKDIDNNPTATSDTDTREGSTSPSNSVKVNALIDNILDDLRSTREKMKQGTLNKDQALHILLELTALYRDVIEMYRSSILFKVRCPSLAALYDLKKALESGRLRESFIRTFLTSERLSKYGILAAEVDMSLDEMEYNQCEQELITDMRKEMEQMEVKKDVDSPLHEMAQEEDARRRYSTTKHDFRRLTEESEFEDPEQLQIRKKIPKMVELAECGLGSTKASRNPEKHMLKYHEGCIRQLDASQLEVETVIDRLQARHLISKADVRDIMQLEDQEKAMRLLELIITAPERAFDELVNALLETGQRELARRLIKSECYALSIGVVRDDQFLTGEAFKPVETTVKHKRGHIHRFIGPRLSKFYLFSYIWEHGVTRRAPYQATSPQLELVEGGRRRKDNIYATNHKRRGKALIFGNQSTGYSSLTGGHAEQDALVGPLQDLGFDVESYLPDRTSTGFIVDKLRTVAKEDYTDADCFLCVVLCNGWVLDGDALLRPFESDNCPSLAGKPKIFIIEGIVSSPRSLEPDYLILQSSWFSPHSGCYELLKKALNEVINRNGEEDFVYVCVEVLRALLEQIMMEGKSWLIENIFVATSFTKDLYLLPTQARSSKTSTETHREETQRYSLTDPYTTKKKQSVATYPTERGYQPQPQTESGGLVKQSKERVAGEEDM